MSLIPLFLPLELTAILDDVKRDLRQPDKAIGIDLGFESQPEYAKAKHGKRPLGFHRMLAAPKALQWAIVRNWRRALLEDERPETPAFVPDADLLEDIAVKLQQIRGRMARAELPGAERKRA